MREAQRHYDELLAEHYSWMFGLSHAEKTAQQASLLQQAGVGAGRLAVDLGSGPGYQSNALADLGFERVLAIDTCAALLEELQREKGPRPIETLCADMVELSGHVREKSADVIVCMGDTLTHLADEQQVAALFEHAYAALTPGGRLVLSFRDLSTELTGTDRFILVRGGADKLMTCFLEYHEGRVIVHDLIHVRREDGWTLLKSSYPKLRLPRAQVVAELQRSGFAIAVDETTAGMTLIAATRCEP